MKVQEYGRVVEVCNKVKQTTSRRTRRAWQYESLILTLISVCICLNLSHSLHSGTGPLSEARQVPLSSR